ncbi:60S ribosomal protein L10a [Camellia lanceoleosa]|uniref:60S ribosomal protein L10a n=1 Tax=Camellia lanceoleosa TaxID=1840588 RepID=A0ACC0H181_9ERIC|nr:60S ribosomal protein L10a [Camellia lanceoleosa]
MMFKMIYKMMQALSWCYNSGPVLAWCCSVLDLCYNSAPVLFCCFDLSWCYIGKFPTPVTHQEPVESKVNETEATVKFKVKKVLCMGVAVGKMRN